MTSSTRQTTLSLRLQTSSIEQAHRLGAVIEGRVYPNRGETGARVYVSHVTADTLRRLAGALK